LFRKETLVDRIQVFNHTFLLLSNMRFCQRFRSLTFNTYFISRSISNSYWFSS